MRATLIHNPNAGDGRPSADDLREMLSAAGLQVRYQSSKKNWKKAIQQKADLIVVAGGDGTVAKVIRELSAIDDPKPLAILPVGTANNISRTLRIRGDARALIASWPDTQPTPLDVGTVTIAGASRPFVEAAGGGIFGQSIETGEDAVENATAFVGNEIDRALQHLHGVIDGAQPRTWRIEIDGADYSGEYIAVEAMNIRHAGPSVPIAPRADPSDGRLDLVFIREEDRAPLLAYADQRLAQHAVHLPRLTVKRGRRILLSVSGAAMHIDDDLVSSQGGEWELGVRPGAVRVLLAPRGPAVKPRVPRSP